MAAPYLCPVCKDNRKRFALVYKLRLEIAKDPSTGEVTWQSGEMELGNRNGRPDIDVECLACGYTGFEGVFLKAAERVDENRRTG